MGIFSFFRKKKSEQTTPQPETTTDKIKNTEAIPEEIIPVIDDDFEIVVPEDTDIIEEEAPQEIYEELDDYDPTNHLSDYHYPSADLLKV